MNTHPEEGQCGFPLTGSNCGSRARFRTSITKQGDTGLEIDMCRECVIDLINRFSHDPTRTINVTALSTDMEATPL